MTTWIALFRGINVGGNNIVRMADLRSDLASLGLQNARTYIQSGNALFESAESAAPVLADRIGEQIERNRGFRPRLLILRKEDLEAAINANPFPEAVSEPKTLHFLFLRDPPSQPDIAALDDAKSPTERYGVTDRVFYLHAPDGIARSKLAAKAEKILGVVTTGRNFRTVEKLLAMALPNP